MYHNNHDCSKVGGQIYNVKIDGVDKVLCQYCFNQECDKAIKVLEEDWKSEAARH